MNRVTVALLALCFTCGIGFVGAPALAGSDNVNCGEACIQMQGARITQPRSVNFDLVCVYFTQLQRGPVVLTLFGANGEVIRTISKITGPAGQFCIGKKSWALRTSAMELCNEDDTRRAEGARLAAIIAAGRTPVGEPVLLVRDE